MNKSVIVSDQVAGEKGPNGADGVGIEVIQRSKVQNPLIAIFGNNKIADPPVLQQIERDTFWIERDRYGGYFINQPSTLYACLLSSNGSAFWLDPSDAVDIVGTVQGPFGQNNATRFTLKKDSSSVSAVLNPTANYPPGIVDDNRPFFMAVWIRSQSSNISRLEVAAPNDQNLGAVSNEWQRKTALVDYDTSGRPSTIIGINPQGGVGATFDLYITSFYYSYLPIDDDINTGSTDAVAFTNDDYRIETSSDEGWPVEGNSVNRVQSAVDFKKWSIVNGSFSAMDTLPNGLNVATAYSGEAPLNRISATASSNITISGNCFNLSAGQTYVVSFYAKLVSGSFSQAQARTGGGSYASLDTTVSSIDASGFKRFAIATTAGSGDTVDIRFTNPLGGFVIDVWGVQVQLDYLSGLAISGAGLANLEHKLPVLPSNITGVISRDYLPPPSGDWTILIESLDLISAMPIDRYIVSNGSDFDVYVNGNALIVNCGTISASVSLLDFNNLAIVHSGGTITIYQKNVVIETASGTPSSVVPDSAYIGNKNGAGWFGGYIKGLSIYDAAFSQNELKLQFGAA